MKKDSLTEKEREQNEEEQKQSIKEDNFAFAFHSILRKCLDCDAASLCWNAIHLLKPGDWDLFVKQMVDKTITRENCVGAVGYGDSARIIFRIGLEQLTDKEYEVIEKYIRE